MATKPYIIALEEHYYDPEVSGTPAVWTRSQRRRRCSASMISVSCV